MKRKLFRTIGSVLLIGTMLFSLTGCPGSTSSSYKFVNTKDSSSYFKIESGSSQSKGCGSCKNVIVPGGYNLTGSVTYNSTTVYFNYGSGFIYESRSCFTVNAAKTTLTYNGQIFKR